MHYSHAHRRGSRSDKLLACIASGGPTAIPEEDVVTDEGTSSGFIRTSGTQFVDQECKEYLPVGMNAWELLEMEMNLVGVRSHPLLYTAHVLC
jgi:hypothetical protein